VSNQAIRMRISIEEFPLTSQQEEEVMTPVLQGQEKTKLWWRHYPL